jgi:hypothetical protein
MDGGMAISSLSSLGYKKGERMERDVARFQPYPGEESCPQS